MTVLAALAALIFLLTAWLTGHPFARLLLFATIVVGLLAWTVGSAQFDPATLLIGIVAWFVTGIPIYAQKRR